MARHSIFAEALNEGVRALHVLYIFLLYLVVNAPCSWGNVPPE